MASLMARGMFQNLESDRIAISQQGQVAVIRKNENYVQLYEVALGIEWMARKIVTGLSRPYDLCFAPNDTLVVSDCGDNTVKIYDLTRNLLPVNQIVIIRDCWGRLFVRTYVDADFNFRRQMMNFSTFQIFQNVVIGPGPLSQLFVTSGREVILINMDWNKQRLVSYFSIWSHVDWQFVQFEKRLVCDNASSVQDHKVSHKVGGFNPLAITGAQFCEMFYHVTETDNTGFLCLERSKCRVGIQGPRKLTETVVIYVRVTEKNGRLLFHARYGNCYEGVYETTTHAEYFMLVDDDFRQAVNLLQDRGGGDINMFMNKQPCFRSTGHRKKTDLKVKDCAPDLINFYNLHCLHYGIKLTISLCQLYKVDMPLSQEDRSLANDITNARQGVKIMFSSGIELNAMRKESWEKLSELANIRLPAYHDSNRQKLDQHINQVLAEIKKIMT